jgi:hypothetical protein
LSEFAGQGAFPSQDSLSRSTPPLHLEVWAWARSELARNSAAWDVNVPTE